MFNLFLYAKWQSRIFNNISGSEQTHHGCHKDPARQVWNSDPARGNVPGVFTNPDLQALYDKLIQQGSASLIESLKVGVL